MDTYNGLSYLGPLIVGLAMLWAVKLAYGSRPAGTRDPVRRLLLMAGWILTVGSTILLVTGVTLVLAVIPLFALLVAVAGYFSYVQAERRALLRLLAIAAEHEIPLDQAAAAYGDERSVQMGSRAARLAELLAAGAPLSSALGLARNPVPPDALLAARLGEATGQMDAALRISVRHNDHFVHAMRGVVARYFYLLAVIAVGVQVLTFVMLRIVPVWTKMFEEFELALPKMTQLLVASSEFVVGYWFLFWPLAAGLMVLGFLGLALAIGWTRVSIPLVDRLWLRCDSALILRALALAVRQDRVLPAMIPLLAEQYPRVNIARRLATASKQIEQGVHWCDALVATGLLRRSDAAVLKSAERVGNLAWALDALADSSLRRFALKLKSVLSICLPIAVVLVGMVVFFVVVGLFLPLVSMIQGLA
jgi:type II secretory pathway component PulF